MICETNAKIINKKIINENYFSLELACDEIFNDIKPGHFIEIEIPGENFIFKRPISISDKKNNTFELLIKIVGKGTKALSEVNIGEELTILGSLGNEFPLVNNKNILILAGGIGVAPLKYLKNELIKRENKILFLYGVNSKNDVIYDDYDDIYSVDGSIGIQGFINKDIAKILENNSIDIIYTCGPNKMLKALQSDFSDKNINIYASLEEKMACGVGACYGCAIPIKDENGEINYKRVCKDGPIFELKRVIFDE